MINTVLQLMHNIRLFCGTKCTAASSWMLARTKIVSYHRWSRYRLCGKRVTDRSQAVIISFVPTSFKSPHYLRPMRAGDTAYFELYATHVFITLFRPVLSKGASKAKIVWHLSMLLSILFMNIFLLQFIFPTFFLSKLFSKTFFSKFFYQNFFPKILLKKFVS